MTRYLLLLVAGAALTPSARACICGMEPLSEHVEQAVEVFAGRPEQDGYDGATAFAVERWWKGSRRTRIVTESEGMCSAPFERGRLYLVVAYKNQFGEGVATSYCVGTGLIPDSSVVQGQDWPIADTSGLGRSLPPLLSAVAVSPGPEGEPSAFGTPVFVGWRPIGVAAFVIIAAMLAGYGVGRRRARPPNSPL